MLAVDGVTVRFSGRTVLDGIELDVAAGEVVAVLGPSGSGKTTMLRAIAGLQPLDGGRIIVSGEDLTGVPPDRRGVGLMFQEGALFPHRDVGSNIGFGLRVRGEPREVIDRRVDELLELVGLGGAARRPVTELSGGEQQRVALARALAPSPRVLLLDEPLGSLDRVLRERLVRELRSLFVSLGQTVVAVTHDHGEAFTLADRVALLDDGKVVQTGPPDEVWGAPATERAARLLGFVNILERDGRRVLVRPDAVRLDRDGHIDATVVERTISGGRMRLVVRSPDGESLELFTTGAAPPVGTEVRVTIDPSGVRPLDG